MGVRKNQNLVADQEFMAKLADFKKKDASKGAPISQPVPGKGASLGKPPQKMSGSKSAQTSPTKSMPNPAYTSPTKTAANPAHTSPTKTAANPAHTSPTKTAANPAYTSPTKRAANPAQTSPTKRTTNLPQDNRRGQRVPTDAVNGSRQYPLSPLVNLLKKGQVKTVEVNRVLVTVNVLGSAGPIRFLVSSDDPVQKVIETVLKAYAREGRLPVLGQNVKQFDLYCANGGYEALDPSQDVASTGARNFLLCRKQQSKIDEEEKLNGSTNHVKGSLIKNWFNSMSMSFGVSSH